ncbi:MAG: nuclear transport factor 2 family protein, partial [Xanthobacteraceae bacterium]
PEKRKHSRHHQEPGVMSRIAVVMAFFTALITSAFAQKAEIESVNAKWIDFFNKGDFAGVASLYTDDASAFPPGSGLVKGGAAIEAMWKGMAEQDWRSETHNPRCEATRPLFSARDRDVHPQNQGLFAAATSVSSPLA